MTKKACKITQHAELKNIAGLLDHSAPHLVASLKTYLCSECLKCLEITLNRMWARGLKVVEVYKIPNNIYLGHNADITVFFWEGINVLPAEFVQGPVVQSVVSLTSSLRIISLTVLADSIYNILIFFAEKM